MADQLSNLTATNALREALIKAAIQALNLAPGSQGLDAGCGIGFQASLLAQTVGPKGQVTGLDFSDDVLAYAQTFIQKKGLQEQISLQKGDVNQIPFEDDTFDWAWSMDCVGYLPQDPLPAIKELRRVVRPGGLVAILAWSSQMLLPGYPLLEARLNATPAGLAPFTVGREAQQHFLRALGWFEQAGFANPGSRTFAGGAHAPMSDDIRQGVEAILQMRWSGVQEVLSAADAELYGKICRPDSEAYILDRPDYAMFFTYTMFSGLVAT